MSSITLLNFEVSNEALFTLGKTAILKIAVFCVTIYTCQKNREVRAGTKDRDFFDRYCACPTCRKGHGSIEGHVEKNRDFSAVSIYTGKRSRSFTTSFKKPHS